jgi:hypothetical protein
MNPFPFPLSNGILFPPKDGFLVKCPSFLRTLSAQPYQKLFASLGDEERLCSDPVGFSVMPLNLDGAKYFVAGVRVEGFYDHKKTKGKIGSDFNPVFPLAAFIDTITKFRAAGAMGATGSPKTNQLSESDKFVSFTMHEIRRLNLDLKAQAEEMIANLSKGSVDATFLDYRAQNIFGTSSLVSIRLDSYDFHVNPEAFATGNKAQIQVFRKFEKTKHCLQVECARKKVHIRLDGQSYHAITGHAVFELLPFVLLENAIKYSPPNQEITVSFLTTGNRLEVIINSIGPLLYEEEQKHLFGRDFRGENARRTCDGTGAGLHFAKLVCNLHGVNIAARSFQQEKMKLNGVPYSYFTVSLDF